MTTNEAPDLRAIYAAIRAGRPWTGPRVEGASYDRDLYHRALTGRGAPITGDEVLALLEAFEERDEDHRRLEEERDKLDKQLDEAWIVPKEEPDRSCGICHVSHDRGDGRCERHGRYVRPAEEIRNAHLQLEVARLRAENERLAAALRGSGPGLHEGLGASPLSVGDHQKDGLLPERLRDPGGDPLGAREERSAASANGAREDLHHVAVLPLPLPHTAGLEERGAHEGATDEPLDLLAKGPRVEGRGEALVAAGAAGDPAADVEAHGAARGKVSARDGARTRKAHAESLARERAALDERVGRSTGKAWLLLGAEPGTGETTIETSWLPDVPEISGALRKLGFRRTRAGGYRAMVLPGDRLGVTRLAIKVIEHLLGEMGT